MKIVTRTAVIFTLFSAFILLIFSVLIYLLAERNRYDEFDDRLRFKITWRAELFFDAGLSDIDFRRIHEHNKKVLHEAQLSIFNANGKIIYADDGEDSYSSSILQQFRSKDRFVWQKGPESYMGLIYNYKGQKYYLIGHAYDFTGYQHVEQIKENLIYLFFGTLLLIFICSFLFANYILQPIKAIIHQIRVISENNLHKRIYHRKAKDELYELIQTSNDTFDRLEKSFKNQQQFVSIISHEFRTPLSTIIAELELSKEMDLTIDDYRKSIDNVLLDAKEASKLSSALLDFARANYDSSQISFEELRIDEVLLEAQMILAEKNKNYSIRIEFDDSQDSQDSDDLVIMGNSYLLKVAFSNLLENGCKYADDNKCTAVIYTRPDGVLIQFVDQGIGIPSQDIPHVFELFYRSTAVHEKIGHGIGLSIVHRIITIHRGQISIDSVVGQGTCFQVFIPK